MAPINLIYLPLTLGVPDGEKFVDKASKIQEKELILVHPNFHFLFEKSGNRNKPVFINIFVKFFFLLFSQENQIF